MNTETAVNAAGIVRRLRSGTIHHPISLGRCYGNRSLNYKERDSGLSQRIQTLTDSAVTSLNTLGLLFQDGYELDEAETSFLNALEILRENNKQSSLNYAAVVSNLGGVYLYNGKKRLASEAFSLAVEIFERAGKEDTAGYGVLLANLGESKVDECDFVAAEPLLVRALKLQESSVSADNLNIAMACNNLATLYQKTNRLSLAHEFLSRAMCIIVGLLPDDHQVRIQMDKNMKTLLQGMKKERP